MSIANWHCTAVEIKEHQHQMGQILLDTEDLNKEQIKVHTHLGTVVLGKDVGVVGDVVPHD